MSTSTPSRRRRRTLARHGALKSPHPLVRLLRLAGVALAVVAVSIVGVAGFAVWNTADAVSTHAVSLGGEESLPPAMGAIEGAVDLLLVGTDSCEGQDVNLFPRCGEDEGGERNDVTMLVHISDNPRRVTVVSIPRDTLLTIPECGDYSEESSAMFNSSYNRGGLKCTVDTVKLLTGVQVQYAAAIRWTGVINLSDAVGGVDVCLAGDVNDDQSNLNLTAGTHTLKGLQALQFLRTRYWIGDGSDLARISNQQQFMSSLVRKLQSDGVLTNPATLFNFASVAMQQVTSGQLQLSEGLADPTRMVQIAMALRSVPIEDFVFVQYPTEYGTGAEDSRVYPLKDAADALFDAIAANQELQLTGDVSGGYGVVAQDEASPPADASSVPDASSTASADPATTDPGVAVLPDVISGTTAAQTTCTVPNE